MSAVSCSVSSLVLLCGAFLILGGMDMAKPHAPEIKQDKAGGWRFHITGRNGEPMVTSESYTSRKDAARGFIDLQEVIWDLAMGREDDEDPDGVTLETKG